MYQRSRFIKIALIAIWCFFLFANTSQVISQGGKKLRDSQAGLGGRAMKGHVILPEELKKIEDAIPTKATSPQLSECSSRFCFACQSAQPNKTPKPIVAAAITIGERSSLEIKSCNNKPAKPTGIVPSNTAQASRLSPTVLRCTSEQLQSFVIVINS